MANAALYFHDGLRPQPLPVHKSLSGVRIHREVPDLKRRKILEEMAALRWRHAQVTQSQVELVVSALDGNSPQVVTGLSAQYNYSYPRWSPDDTRIAYQRSQVFRSDIFVAPSQGGQPRPITDDAVMMSGFAWLPDGSGI